MTITIAVSNEKGGVAKTTTSVSLAGALLEMEKEILLVDLDPQSNLTLALGFSPENIRHSITDVLLNAATPLSTSIETSLPGLDLIPSNEEMAMAERFLPIRQDYRHILRRALEPVNHYDFIILDCPPSLGSVTHNAFVAASFLIVPTQAEYFSTYALKNVIKAIQAVRRSENPALKFKILITMQDLRVNAHKTLTEELRNTFNSAMFDTVIQVDTKLRETTIVGLPITHYVPRSRSARQYRALAQELTDHVASEYITQPS